MRFDAWLFAQQDFPSSSDEGAAAAGALGGLCVLIYLAFLGVFVVLVVAGAWKMFEKAGKPGWAAIVPIYNTIVLLEIVGRPIWWIVLLLIPCVNFVVAIIVSIDLAKSFGKSELFGVGLAFLHFIFYPILGFGSAAYVGPSVQQ